MMSYEFWVEQLLDVMKIFADRNYQLERWLATDAKAWEHPGELICVVFDDLTFDLFIEMYKTSFNVNQLKAAKTFQRVADHWNESTSESPDVRETIDSLNWIAVTEAAAEFIRAFAPRPEQPA